MSFCLNLLSFAFLLATLSFGINAMTIFPPPKNTSLHSFFNHDICNNRRHSYKIFGFVSRLGMMSKGVMNYRSVVHTPMKAVTNPKIGFAVGGSKDVNTFRDNIEKGFLPLESSITYNGLFYDYYFQPGKPQNPCTKLFCPTYTKGTDQNGVNWLSVGLTSGKSSSSLKRKKLNLVVLLDVSGSMSARFDEYYYDRVTKKRVRTTETKSKMQVALEAITGGLLKHLRPTDRFGMAMFDGTGYIGKEIHFVKNTDMEAIKSKIKMLRPCGSTNFEAGYISATSLFKKQFDNSKEYESRIIMLTDAMPNTGNTGKDSLFGMLHANAHLKAPIYTTLIGVGLDFNTDLVKAISNVRGGNYYSVHSEKQFKLRMDEEFEFMVSPLVFDLKLTVGNADKTEQQKSLIDTVYGVPGKRKQNAMQLVHVKTLFPTKTLHTGGVKGGVILLKLEKVDANSTIRLFLDAVYTKNDGLMLKESVERSKVEVSSSSVTRFGSPSVRKAILLVKYAKLLKEWVRSERTKAKKTENKKEALVGGGRKHPLPSSSQWEQKSVPLRVSEVWKKKFSDFLKFFKGEMKHIPIQSKDDDLKREVELLQKLIGTKY